MTWENFLKAVRNLPVIETEALYTGTGKLASVEVQLSRWQKAGKLIQLKRGLYALAETYRKINIYGPYVASLLRKPSYLSLEKALEFHNLIPERVRPYTSVTTKLPVTFETGLGEFAYNHIQKDFFWGYSSVTLNAQTAYVATPEKALLDFFYLRHAPVTREYIDELRLQNLEDLSERRLLEFASRMNKKKLLYAAGIIKQMVLEAKKHTRKR